MPYQPPRRESIDHHLEVARARVHIPGDGWTDRLATRPWVEDLIREEIIGGPYAVKKRLGRGQGQRFWPGDYRDLLRVIALKAQACVHRSAWIAHLWLHGRDYPIERVRAAFRDEIARLTQAMLRDFAPTQRLYKEPFSKKYERHVRLRREGQIMPELNEIGEIFGALSIDPVLVKQTNPDTSTIAADLGAFLRVDPEELEPLIGELTMAMTNGSSISPTTAARLYEIAMSSSHPLIQASLQDENLLRELGALPQRFTKTIGTFAGDSTLLQTIDAATEEQWTMTRAAFRNVGSGDYESAIRHIQEELPDQLRSIAPMLETQAEVQRRMVRGTPWVRLYAFVLWLHEAVLSMQSAPIKPQSDVK